jgi:hypothetical protein
MVLSSATDTNLFVSKVSLSSHANTIHIRTSEAGFGGRKVGAIASHWYPLMPRGGRCEALPIWLEDQLCGASGWSAEVDADVEVEVLG